jgi:predicted metal-dependent peptidase
MNEKISKAKALLVLDQPFFASLLLTMPIHEDKKITTMATNGDWIKFNPEFVDKLSIQELIFVLAHETMHCVFQHMLRRGDKNHNKYNIAGDYVINDHLIREHVGEMPHGGLHNPQLVQEGNGTTEGVYALLPKEDEQKTAGNMGQGGSMDEVESDDLTQAEANQKSEEMRVKVIQAKNAAKTCGKFSAGLERLVNDLTRPRIDWRTVLRRFLSDRAKVDLSYAKPKRRFMADDVNLPSLLGEQLGEIVIAVDCSGSIDDKLLNEFGTEISSIKEDTKPVKVHVIYFDSEVLRHDEFSRDDDLRINACGGGGTAFSPVFRYIQNKNISPVACVFLTDLQCNDFGQTPSYNVMWASTDNGNAPFGEILLLKDAA